MDQNISFDSDLLDLFSQMIEDNTEKLILQGLFSGKDLDEMIDQLIIALEQSQDD